MVGVVVDTATRLLVVQDSRVQVAPPPPPPPDVDPDQLQLENDELFFLENDAPFLVEMP